MRKSRKKAKQAQGGGNSTPPPPQTQIPSTKKNTKPSWTSLPWRKVDLNGTTTPSSSSTKHDDDPSLSSNHYDDPNADFSDLYETTNGKSGSSSNSSSKKQISSKRQKYDDDDANVEGANDPGIIVGLEVIDGSQYRVERVAIDGGSNKDIVGYVNRLVTTESSTEENATKTEEKQEEKEHTKDEKQQKQEEKFNEKKRKRKEKKKMNKAKGKPKTTNDASTTAPKTASADEINTVQTAWSQSSSGATLHPTICASLHRLGFTGPTPIQAATLAASILGRRDIVGAAPTGSGKTFSYLLPILQHLFYDEDDKNENTTNNEKDEPTTTTNYPLTALILCPTRELALQVSKEFVNLLPPSPPPPSKPLHIYGGIKCGCIVGGLSEQKQRRVLDKKKPPVIVGTPGRLWQLMERKEHEHLNNLTKLRFLVVDEADRMISQGNFPQLTKIFDEIQKVDARVLESMESNVRISEMSGGDGGDYEQEDDPELGEGNKLMGLAGVSKVMMLDDILKAREKKNSIGGSDQNDEQDENDKEVKEEKDDVDDVSINSASDSEEEEVEDDPPVHRQTFVYSATLTIPQTSDGSSSNTNDHKRKKGTSNKKEAPTVDGAIAEILERAGAIGETKIIDLSTSTNNTASSSKKSGPSIRLPPGLSLYQVECTQLHKDSHLYLYLTTTLQGTSGPSLIFCNSIGAVRRVGETLRILGLPVRTLHASMPQKARFTALESLQSSSKPNKRRSRNILVATDVAARGLDLPSVATVVHYDVPRSMETFLHRAGRTARGIGPDAVGTSVSLVSAPEAFDHAKICSAVLGVGERGTGNKSNNNPPQRKAFEGVAGMDGRMMATCRTRVNLASKIYNWEDATCKREKEDQWFVKAAEEADVDLEEGTLQEDGDDGDNRRRMEQLEYKRAKVELKVLLSKPMRTQEFGKFLSAAGMEKARSMEEEVTPFIVSEAGRSGGKGKKKNKRRRIR